MDSTRKGTCDVCKKVRKLYRYDEYYYSCSECINLSPDEKNVKRAEVVSHPKPRFAYPIVGGPLDGEYAIKSDFLTESGKPGQKWYRPEGIYAHLQDEYHEFNSSHGFSKRLGGFPSMIFVHKSVLKPLVSPKKR